MDKIASLKRLLNPKKIAVIGAGPGGISAAWQLTLKGHTPTLFDTGNIIGGKIASVIPGSRIPKDILETELKRVNEFIPDIRLSQVMDKKEFSKIKFVGNCVAI